ncbi:hypothetical protein CYMTET_37561 [Cymbomonas tetramitiformis]|uniref:Uncharacterized protein n=1 Tax=Cymbomonas tetramitiformis TaxID=36881 RepID=A0AAE0CFA3_9CHLO|nr:hypothetical protein CYMTET_37561 [Cymbomonas tetramitiformis]
MNTHTHTHAEARGDRRATAEADEERVLRDAVQLVKAGQLGKAAKRLELATLKTGTEETLQKLERLHPAGTGRRREVEEDRRQELQAQALELDEGVFNAMVREWLAGARLVALLKDDSGNNDDERDGLRAIQVRVAVKGGADLCVHTVQAALDQHPEWLCVKVDAKNAFDGMPGARGELGFIDVCVSAEMSKKVENLCAILLALNKLGHAQAQGLLLRFCAHPRNLASQSAVQGFCLTMVVEGGKHKLTAGGRGGGKVLDNGENHHARKIPGDRLMQPLTAVSTFRPPFLD